MAPSAECQQNFPDDPEIQDTHQMLRRIPPWHVVPDANAGGSRPSSAAFEDDDDGSPMSVYRRTVIEATGGNIDRVMVGHVGYGLAGINAGDLRSRDQTIHSDPCLKNLLMPLSADRKPIRIASIFTGDRSG